MRLGITFGAFAAALLAGALCLFPASQARQPLNESELNMAGAADAGSLFGKHCASCHGRDGRSKTVKGRLTHARDIADAGWQNDVSDERIFNSINNGRGKKMPRFDKKLSESQIDELITYVRRLKR
ncbi:MAG: hypothetical protein QOD75_2259 [Blastocatellia bacterium]|nr:hypothetical protein [Blastocatellia bacterium]